MSDLEIVQTSLRFLKLDISFYRHAWNWTPFFERLHNKGCNLQKYLSNQIAAMILGMSNSESLALNQNIPEEISIESEIEQDKVSEIFYNTADGELVEWEFKSDIITNIEGIYLPIFNKSVVEYYKQNNLDIVRVGTTKINLRSLALGVSSGKAICLCGFVGSGK